MTEALQVRSGATTLLSIFQSAANTVKFGSGTVAMSLDSGSAGMFLASPQFVVDGTGQWIHRCDFDLRGPSNTDLEVKRRGRLATILSGAQNVMTYAMANNTGHAFEAFVTVTNITSKETSRFWFSFAAQNNSGTGSDSGAPENVVTAIAESGLTATLDRSGTTVRVRIYTPDTDSREARALLIVRPSSLV